MNYQKIYNQLITRRQNEILHENIYGEIHHIVPKCLGGNNDKSNLVRLTAREHYIAHLLLAKIHNIFGLYSAVIFMQSGRIKNRKFKFNSRLYQKLREEFAKKNSEHFQIVNTGKHWYTDGKINRFCFECPKGFIPGRSNYKRTPLTEETKQKISNSRKGKCFMSDEHKKANGQRLALLNISRRGIPLSEEHRHKLSILQTGKKRGPYKKKNQEN